MRIFINSTENFVSNRTAVLFNIEYFNKEYSTNVEDLKMEFC